MKQNPSLKAVITISSVELMIMEKPFFELWGFPVDYVRLKCTKYLCKLVMEHVAFYSFIYASHGSGMPNSSCSQIILWLSSFKQAIKNLKRAA